MAAAVASLVVDSAVVAVSVGAAFTAGTLADLEEGLAVSGMVASSVSVSTDSSSAAASHGFSDSISGLVLTGTDTHTLTAHGGARMPIRIPTIRITAQTIAITLRTQVIRPTIATTMT